MVRAVDPTTLGIEVLPGVNSIPVYLCAQLLGMLGSVVCRAKLYSGKAGVTWQANLDFWQPLQWLLTLPLHFSLLMPVSLLMMLDLALLPVCPTLTTRGARWSRLAGRWGLHGDWSRTFLDSEHQGAWVG